MERLRAENETLREQLEEMSQPQETQLPDLQEIRDRILKEWKLSRTAEKKERLWEFSERLIRAIEEAIPEPDYPSCVTLRGSIPIVQEDKRKGNLFASYHRE